MKAFFLKLFTSLVRFALVPLFAANGVQRTLIKKKDSEVISR